MASPQGLRSLLSYGTSFALAKTAAKFAAMAFNHTLNNSFTYGNQRWRGWRFLSGFGMFAGLCSVGVVGGVGVSTPLYTRPVTLVGRWSCRSGSRRLPHEMRR